MQHGRTALVIKGASMFRYGVPRNLLLRILATIIFWLSIGTPLFAAGVSIRIDCGRERGDREAEERRELSGRSFSYDQKWHDGARYGHVGGRPRWDFFPWYAEGTHIPDVYRRRREGVKAYKFNLSSGGYVITLGFLERRAHCAGMREFSVSVGGKVLIKDLDVFAVAGLDRACTSRFYTRHSGGVLTLKFEGGGEFGTMVSLIEIKRRKPDRTPPVPTPGVKAIAGFGENIIIWNATDEDDIAGYFIERAKGNGRFEKLNADPLPVRMYVDRGVSPDTNYRYRIVAEDVFGNRGKPSKTASARPLNKTKLPVYELTVEKNKLRKLMINPAARVSVPAVFAHKGKRYEVKFRLRGASTRWLAKKGFKIVFPKKSTFDGRQCINLKAQLGDATLQQEKLSLDLINVTRAAASQAKYIHLRINGRFNGVYVEIEEIDEAFLKRTGRSTDGLLYRSRNFQQLQKPRSYIESFRARTAAARDREAAIAFVEFLNRATNGEFDGFVEKYFNMEQVLDYLCVLALLERTEIEAGDYFMYRSPKTGLWELLTWDNNNGNLGIRGFRRELHLEGEGSILPNSVFCVPPGNPYWHTIQTRLFYLPQFRERYFKRLRQMCGELLSPGRIKDMIENNHASIKRDVCADWHKFPSTDNGPFLQSTEVLKAWAQRRRAFINKAERKHPEKSALVVSEFLAYPQPSTENSEPRGKWIEIHNRSKKAVRLDRFYLTKNLHNYRMWRFPGELLLKPDGHLVIHADGERHDGAPSANFRLSSDGGEIGLFEIRGERMTVHDIVFYGSQNRDISYGRASSAGDKWGYFLKPTPDKRNPAKNISDHHIYGVSAEHDDSKYIISAVVLGAAGECSVSAIVKAGREYFCIKLEKVPDSRGAYRGDISLPRGVVASYYVVARTKNGITKTYPLTAPERKLRLIPDTTLESPVVINELMATNRKTVRNDRGEYGDWIELHNITDREVSTRGLCLTDDSSLLHIWMLPPDLKIPPKGYLLLWADGPSDDSGRFHTSFQLSSKGETLYLLRRNGRELYLLDKVTYPGLGDDESYARVRDGSSWCKTAKPSPDRKNSSN
ncbi:MAG: hypothetical protein E3J72_16715 [Planctomycetota bacterium]|nr:MAG: hypothetical protein E3J72_16715 [Planctomycetota bacterium]